MLLGKSRQKIIKQWNKNLQISEWSAWVHFSDMDDPAEGLADEKKKKHCLSIVIPDRPGAQWAPSQPTLTASEQRKTLVNMSK